jgi:hypothetical protein
MPLKNRVGLRSTDGRKAGMKRRRHMGGARGVVMGALAITAAVAPLGGAATASASPRGVPQAMVGCWHRHVPAVPGLTPAGVWLVKITAAGKLAAYTPGTTRCGADRDFTAIISVSGSTLTIGAVPVCTPKGIYTWKTAASTLTLHATADKGCSPRRILFTGVWKKT